MRVLVVEDETKMAGLLRRGLAEEGHVADVARTGTDAVWLGTEILYDAMVLDVMLPDIDGFEVCRRLGRRPLASHPRTIGALIVLEASTVALAGTCHRPDTALRAIRTIAARPSDAGRHEPRYARHWRTL